MDGTDRRDGGDGDWGIVWKATVVLLRGRDAVRDVKTQQRRKPGSVDPLVVQVTRDPTAKGLRQHCICQSSTQTVICS